MFALIYLQTTLNVFQIPTIQDQLDIDPKYIYYHTDSKVVLCYIYNRTNVSILTSATDCSRFTKSHHQNNSQNYTDQATRPIAVENMKIVHGFVVQNDGSCRVKTMTRQKHPIMTNKFYKSLTS